MVLVRLYGNSDKIPKIFRGNHDQLCRPLLRKRLYSTESEFATGPKKLLFFGDLRVLYEPPSF